MEIFRPSSSAGNRKRKRGGASVRVAKPTRQVSWGFVFKTLVFLAVVGLGMYGALSTPKVVETVSSQRVEQINIEGEVNYINEQDVLAVVNSFISESLLLVDMDQIKSRLEEMPWMRSVTIRREWPDTLVLSVTEEMAIARWGDGQLLNQDGEIFSPKNIIGLEHLAILSGPENSAGKIMEHYQLFNQLLYQRGLKIGELDLDARGAWTLGLANGVQIKIGKSDVMKRMRRLVAFIDPLFVEKMKNVESIDLRYDSGLAVRDKQIQGEEVVSL